MCNNPSFCKESGSKIIGFLLFFPIKAKLVTNQDIIPSKIFFTIKKTVYPSNLLFTGQPAK